MGGLTANQSCQLSCVLPLQVPQVIEPVRSRCLCVRVRSPSHEEMRAVLERVSLAEHLTIPAVSGGQVGEYDERAAELSVRL